MLGFQIGEVHDVQLMFDGRTGQPYTQALVAIYSAKLGAPDAMSHDSDADALRTETDGRVNALLAKGYRAHLIQSPPLIGGRAISFDPSKLGAAKLRPAGAGSAYPVIPSETSGSDRGPSGCLPECGAGAAGAGSAYPVIPSETSGSDLDDLTSQADQILKKVNQVPIAAIGEDVRQITGRLRALVASPVLNDSLNHLDSTLDQVDQIMSEVKPQIGPLIGRLNETADQLNGTVAAARGVLGGEGATQDASLPGAIQQLTEAARSIRSLSDYLGRHPEALIKGKVKDTSR